jgi:hypothetical protein
MPYSGGTRALLQGKLQGKFRLTISRQEAALFILLLAPCIGTASALP